MSLRLLFACLARGARGWIPVWTYWLLTILCLGGATAAFATSRGDFCSAAALAAIAAIPRAADTCLDYWLYRYQTLFGGGFMLIAAWIGFYAVYRQTRQAEEAEQLRCIRDAQAARAVLPLALSDVCDYAEEGSRRLQAEARYARDAAGERYSLPIFRVRQ